MDTSEHEYYVNWIIANSIHFTHNEKSYCIKSPSRDAKFYAQEIFFEFYYKAIEEGVIDSEEMSNLLVKLRLWDNNKENILKKMKDEIEELKINVFQNYLNTPMRNKIKIAIKDTQNYIMKLYSEKMMFEQNSAEGLASYAKQQFLLGASIYTARGKPYWKSYKCWNLPDNILNSAARRIVQFNLGDTQYRELAKGDYWRSIWATRKNGNLFGKASIDLADPQKAIIFWSVLYDNVYSSSECPADQLIEDDDALDGWLILQRRKRKNQLNKDTVESLMSEKIKNSQHVFIITGEEDRDKVYEMNDIAGKVSLHKRLNQIKQQGLVTEANMTDTREQLKMQAASLFNKE